MDYKKTFITELNRFCCERDGITGLIQYLGDKTDFFEAPASTKYHGSYKGGTCIHSLTVFKRTVKLIYDEYCANIDTAQVPKVRDFLIPSPNTLPQQCEDHSYVDSVEVERVAEESPWFIDYEICARVHEYSPYSMESIALVSLLHDVCKVDTYVTEMRNVKADNKWESVPFYKKDELFTMGHGAKSVFIVQNFVPLYGYEAQAIYWHMGGHDIPGQYDQGVWNAFGQNKLAIFLYFADVYAAFVDGV